MKLETLLLRQVHPNWIQGTTISNQTFTSQTFKPTPKDNGMLSVYNGDIFDAKKAFTHYTESQGLLSAGVVAITMQECKNFNLPVHEDNCPFEGHCNIDYCKLNNTEVKIAATSLKSYALLRGWLYQKEQR